jgi:hypothetical protein
MVGNGTSAGSRSNLIAAYRNKLTVTGSVFVNSGSFDGQVVTNGGDTFTSTAPVMNIVSLTAAEYSGLSPIDPNTMYVII